MRARRLPYEYYGLPFCQPDTLETVAENLGEVLRGDKISNSNYDLKMGVEETCKVTQARFVFVATDDDRRPRPVVGMTP